MSDFDDLGEPTEDLETITDEDRAAALADEPKSEAEIEAEALIRFTAGETERADTAEALYQEQLAEAESKSKWAEPPEHELTDMEKAAQVAAHWDASEITNFKIALAESAAKQRAEARKYTGEPDPDAAPEPEPFNANALSSGVFGALTRAVQTGGASITDVPAGFDYDGWVGYVNQRLGR